MPDHTKPNFDLPQEGSMKAKLKTLADNIMHLAEELCAVAHHFGRIHQTEFAHLIYDQVDISFDVAEQVERLARRCPVE